VLILLAAIYPQAPPKPNFSAMGTATSTPGSPSRSLNEIGPRSLNKGAR